jgi:hypothetical protein
METPRQSTANQGKVARLEAAWAALLVDVLQRGFHGQASIEVLIQDGTIQRISRSVQRIER